MIKLKTGSKILLFLLLLTNFLNADGVYQLQTGCDRSKPALSALTCIRQITINGDKYISPYLDEERKAPIYSGPSSKYGDAKVLKINLGEHFTVDVKSSAIPFKFYIAIIDLRTGKIVHYEEAKGSGTSLEVHTK